METVCGITSLFKPQQKAQFFSNKKIVLYSDWFKVIISVKTIKQFLMFEKKNSLSINTTLTIRRVVTALHGAVVIGHCVQIIQGVPRTVQAELPHVQVLQGEIYVGLFLSVGIAHVLFGVDVESLEMDDQNWWKTGYVQFFYSISLLFASGAVPARYRFTVQVEI